MNVSCPQCSTIFRVDPAKVPPGGVRARCSTCSGVIPVGIRTATPPRPSQPVDAIGAAFGARPTPPPFVPPRAQRTATPPRATMPAETRAPTPPRPAPAAPARQATPPRQATVRSTPVTSPRSTPPMPSPALGAALPPLRPTPQTPWTAVGAPPAPQPV